MDFPITLSIPEFRPLETTPQGIARALVETMGGVIETGILSTEDQPITFEPNCLKVGNVCFETEATSNRLQMLQNKAGEIALLDDAYGIRDTVILPEGLVSVDWDMGNEFLCVLSGNRQPAFYMFHQKPGMEISLTLVNKGTNQVVGTFDPLIQWPGGSAPVMPAAFAGTAAAQKINIVDVNGVLYGEYLNYSATPQMSGL